MISGLPSVANWCLRYFTVTDFRVFPLIPDSPKVLTCVTFEHGWDHLQGSKGIYVANHGVKVVSSGCFSGHCGYFNGHSYLSIPFFTNNYQKNGFSVSFIYNAEEADATMDLITNLCVQSTSGTASLDIV